MKSHGAKNRETKQRESCHECSCLNGRTMSYQVLQNVHGKKIIRYVLNVGSPYLHTANHSSQSKPRESQYLSCLDSILNKERESSERIKNPMKLKKENNLYVAVDT